MKLETKKVEIIKRNIMTFIALDFKIKNLVACTIVVAGCLSITSCEDILEQNPVNEVDQEIVVTDEQSARAAVAGMYNEMQSSDYYGDNFIIIGDVSSDIAQSIGTWDFYREMDTYEISAAGNTENENFYVRAYSTINIANNVIEKIPQLSNISSEAQNEMIGAAHFIRALAMFDLTRLYGGVPGVVGSKGMPIITTPTNSLTDVQYPSRPALEESYRAVEQDLLDALDLLPETGDKSVASKGAAQALLSRLYLYLMNYEEVIFYTTAVISDPKYALNPNFEDIFASKLGSGSIFELNFNSSDQSGIRNWYNPNGGRGDLTTHQSFYEEATANPADVRGNLFGFSESNGFYQTKYQKPGGVDNIHILRVAEMYLNRAEARAHLGDLEGAIDDLNVIRTRAGIGEIETEPSTKTGVLEAIWDERKLEFAFEGHRYFDLMRTDQLMNELKNLSRMNGPNVSLPGKERAVFPIPAAELDANENLIQNEAYR